MNSTSSEPNGADASTLAEAFRDLRAGTLRPVLLDAAGKIVEVHFDAYGKMHIPTGIPSKLAIKLASLLVVRGPAAVVNARSGVGSFDPATPSFQDSNGAFVYLCRNTENGFTGSVEVPSPNGTYHIRTYGESCVDLLVVPPSGGLCWRTKPDHFALRTIEAGNWVGMALFNAVAARSSC